MLQKIAVYAFSDGISKALPFLLFPIMAYYLSKEEFGLVTNYNVLISILGPFIGMSASSYLAVEYHNKESDAKSLYQNLLYFNLFLFGIVSVVIFSVYSYFESWSGLQIKWISLAIISSVFAAFTDIFFIKIRMDENAKLFGIVNVLNSFLTGTLTILFVIFFKWGWQGRIYSLFLGTCLLAMLSFYFSRSYLKKIKKPNIKLLKNMFGFGLPLLPHQLAVWIKTGLEKFYITSSLGLEQNGVYSFAITICAIFVIVSNAFFSAFSPYIYKSLSEINSFENEYKIKINVVKKSYIFLIIYFFILIIGGVLSTLLIHYFFNEKYGVSVKYLPYLLAFNFFNSCYIVLSIFIYYSKSTKYLGLISITTSLLQVFLMMYLVEYFGAIGAAMASCFVSIVTMIVVYFYSNYVCSMPWFNFSLIFKTKI